MGLPNEAFLLTFAGMAVTFSAVSALVTVMRQTMGGKLSSFDVYLVAAFSAHGFVLAIAALLPSLVSQYSGSAAVIWPISGVLAGSAMAFTTIHMQQLRRKVASGPMPVGMALTFAALWIGVGLFLLGAPLASARSPAVYATALTLCLATIMWMFVRRISSLLGKESRDDWDLSRG